MYIYIHELHDAAAVQVVRTCNICIDSGVNLIFTLFHNCCLYMFRLGVGNSNIFYFHPENWGRWTHFDSYFWWLGWSNHQPVDDFTYLWIYRFPAVRYLQKNQLGHVLKREDWTFSNSKLLHFDTSETYGLIMLCFNLSMFEDTVDGSEILLTSWGW